MHKKDIIFNLIKKRENQPLTPEEEFLVEVWLETHIEEQKKIATPQLNTPLSSFQQKIIREINRRTQKNRIVRQIKWMGIAASLLLFVGFSINLITKKLEKSKLEQLALTYTEYQTVPGKIQRITLVDGSKIILKPSSKLRVSKAFGKTNRKIILSGDAYFDIAKDSILSFNIQTPSFDVSVLGTTFNLNTRAGLDKQKVDVLSGKVLVSKKGSFQYKLYPNDQLIYSTSKNKHEINHNHMLNSKEISEGVIQIKEQSFRDIAEEFHQVFGMKIQYPSELNGKERYSLTIRMKLGPDAIMEQLAMVTQMQFKKVNDHYIIY